MKYVVLLLVIMGGGLGYLRIEQPETWNSILQQLRAPSSQPDSGTPSVVESPPLPPAQMQPVVQPAVMRPTQPEIITPDSTHLNPDHVRQVDQPAQDHANEVSNVSANTSTGPITPKQYVAPYPLPQRPNWNWTINGREYDNVVVTQAEADLIHITYDGGVGTVNQSELPPDLQKQFNYDPQLAMVAMKQRTQASAQIDAEEAPKIAAMKQQQASQQAAEDAQAAAQRQAGATQENIAVAQDQKRNYEQDAQQMIDAHEVSMSVNSQTGVVTYGGTQYWLGKYYADQRTIADCDRIINSGRK